MYCACGIGIVFAQVYLVMSRRINKYIETIQLFQQLEITLRVAPTLPTSLGM